MSPLQDLVIKRLRQLDISMRAAAARSNGLVNVNTISRIANGKSGNGTLRKDTIDGLSLALDLPREVIAAADSGNTDRRRGQQLLTRLGRLPAALRSAELDRFEALVEIAERHGRRD